MVESDKSIKCRDCGEEFVFSAGEQAFYKERGFQHEPTRCRRCRDEKKRQGTGPATGGMMASPVSAMSTVLAAPCGMLSTSPARRPA